jgi:RNA methyltransferase, TrmH family
MNYQKIIAKDNNKLKQLTKLATNKAYRYEQNQAVIYGVHLVQEALKHNILNTVFISMDMLITYQALLKNCDPERVYILDNLLLNKCKLSDSAIDIAATIWIRDTSIDDQIYLQDCIILEDIQDPGNLGTIMRVATASGIKNLILSSGCVDPYNIKVLRASQGLQFSLNIICDVNLAQLIDKYKIQVLATAIDADKSIYTCDLINPTAWVFGNEGSGLSARILSSKCDQVSIPMLGNAESLNVAMAATVCMFETMRQRLLFSLHQ